MDFKIHASILEESAREQLDTIRNHVAFEDSKIRIMPDAHAGKGCVIGFTSTYTDKVIPNITGVDLGCGILATNLGKVAFSLPLFDKKVRKLIPIGTHVHDSPNTQMLEYLKMYLHIKLSDKELNHICCSVGTLGGGNHFIELGTDSDSNVWLLIHTGSRNLGLKVAEYYQNLAITKCIDNIFKFRKEQFIEEMKRMGKQNMIQDALKSLEREDPFPKELSYLTGRDLDDYLHDVYVCQSFACNNIMTIRNTILEVFELSYKEEVYSVHNYIDLENKIIRKGSISAQKGQRVVIPLNMADGTIIGTGLGNPDWNYSAPHGAGRVMSRNQAKKLLKLSDFEKSMKGIYSTSISEKTIDEAPMVYKPASVILEDIKDTVTVDTRILPIWNLKASD